MNLSKIDLNLLKVFEHLYAEQNVTRAAQKLGIAQSSLSSALKRLRELFEDELFVRSPNGMQPTKRAIEIESSISDCLSAARRAISQPQNFNPSDSKRMFIIGGSDFAAFTILPKLIKHLSKIAPHIRLEMKALLPDDLLHHIDSTGVDLAISTDRKFPKRIYSKKLFEEDMVVLARSNHPKLSGKKKITLKEYASMQHIYITSKIEAERNIERVLKKNSLRRDIYLKVQNFLVVPYIVENSDLIATLSKKVAYQCSQKTKIKIYPFPKKIEKNDFNLIWGKASNSDIETMWLINQIIELLSKDEKSHS